MTEKEVIKVECFWCSEIKNLSKCKSCKGICCKSCLIRICKRNEESFTCVMCTVHKLNEVKSKTSATDDTKVIHMLSKLEDMFTKNKLLKTTSSLIDDMNSINVDEFPIFLNIILRSISSMMNDFQKLSVMVHQAIDNDNLDVAIEVYLPLFKVLIKRHFINRLGSPSQYLNFFESNYEDNISPENWLAKSRDQYDDILESSPQKVSTEENIINVAKLKYDDDVICDEITQIKDESFLKNLPRLFNNQHIISNDRINSGKLLKFKMGLSNGGIYNINKYVESQKKQIKKNIEKRSKCKSHYVSPLIDNHNKSSIIKNPEIVGVQDDKKWSWEQPNSKNLIPIQNLQSVISSVNSNKKLLNEIPNNSVEMEQIQERNNLPDNSDGLSRGIPHVVNINEGTLESLNSVKHISKDIDLRSETFSNKNNNINFTEEKYSAALKHDSVTQVKEETSLKNVSLEDFYKSLKSRVKIFKDDIINTEINDSDESVEEFKNFPDKECKRNPHLLRHTNDTHEKSFVINDDDLFYIPQIKPPFVEKKWSWEQTNEKVAMTLKNGNSVNKNVTLKSKESIKRKDVSFTFETSCQTRKKKGRPRKYFNDYET